MLEVEKTYRLIGRFFRLLRNVSQNTAVSFVTSVFKRKELNLPMLRIRIQRPQALLGE